MLSGLQSLCTIPCECIYLKAQPSSAIQNRTASSVKVFREMWNRKSPPFIRSTTRYLNGSQPDPLNSSTRGYPQIFNILEAISQVAKKRVVQLFKHPSLSNYVPHALGPYHCPDASAHTPCNCSFVALTDPHLCGCTSMRT